MASKEHKIVRRAEAMSQLSFLSTLLAERFNIESINMQVSNRDAELAEIERIERVNELLRLLAEMSEPSKQAETVAKPVTDEVKKPVTVKSTKHGANK